MMDDITYCASDCECINCPMNKANIKDPNVLHSWATPEAQPFCPMKDWERMHERMVKDCSGIIIWRATE